MGYLGKVVTGLLRKGNKFLIGFRPSDKPDPNMVEVSGGKVDLTDATLESALIREYKEETDLDIIVGALIWDAVLEFSDGQWHIHMFEVFASEDQEPVCKVHQWLKWLTWEEMQQYPMAPSLVKVMEGLNDKN